MIAAQNSFLSPVSLWEDNIAKILIISFVLLMLLIASDLKQFILILNLYP